MRKLSPLAYVVLTTIAAVALIVIPRAALWAQPPAPRLPATLDTPSEAKSPTEGGIAPAKPAKTAAERGYEVLRTKAFLPPDFTTELFNDLWQVWPDRERKAFEALPPAEWRKRLFAEYGLVEADDGYGETALGYVDDGRGGWVMNCFSCHGGKVLGKTIPGLPNSHYGLHTLTADVTALKLRRGIKLGHMDLGAATIPLGTTHGTTNAVVFGVALLSKRDPELRVDLSLPTPPLVHHDLDAPPLWHLKKKSRLYYDSFMPKNHRVLMQFIFIPKNDGPRIKSWEQPFADVLAWIEALEAPAYPFPVDKALAAQGEEIFAKSCAECHGTYGATETYPERVIPIDEIGTDRVRFDAIDADHRALMSKSWLVHYGQDQVVIDTKGYVAPPLDGIWATAPYLHNGSVPTLWHLLHPESRPAVWKRTEDGYDRARIGLEVETFDRLPTALGTRETRRYFDTTKPGKSAAGHDYPAELTEDEKRAVLEYLKTL